MKNIFEKFKLVLIITHEGGQFRINLGQFVQTSENTKTHTCTKFLNNSFNQIN